MKLSKDTFISTYLLEWCWRFVHNHYYEYNYKCTKFCIMDFEL